MASLKKLISVFEETRRLLARPDNNFAWSSWEDREDALVEIDKLLSSLRSGSLQGEQTIRVLFAPTGPIQEVSLSSGWATDFIELANRFDDAVACETHSGGTQLVFLWRELLRWTQRPDLGGDPAQPLSR